MAERKIPAHQAPEHFNVSELQDIIFTVENTPWNYEPTDNERKVLEDLRKIITDYQEYLNDTEIKKGRK